MSDMIKGVTEDITGTGDQLINFSSDLNEYLTNIRNAVDDIAESTYGKSSPQLLDNYYRLDSDLRTYVTELDTLGNNIKTSANNLELIDENAAANLSYEG